jgi:hypothetical protein
MLALFCNYKSKNTYDFTEIEAKDKKMFKVLQKYTYD